MDRAQLLAAGYPHLRRLVEGHPHDAEALTYATKVWRELDPITYFVDWPAEVARRWVRAYAVARTSLSEEAQLENGAALDAKEARTLIAGLFDPEHYIGYRFRIEHAVGILEAIIGTEGYVDAILEEFEGLKRLVATFDTRVEVAYQLGFAIRRLDPKHRKAAEKRIAALVKKHPRTAPNLSAARNNLSYIIGGREALIESGERLGAHCVHFADPATIVEGCERSISWWDVQHVVHGGEAALDVLAATKPAKLSKFDKPWIVEQLGVLGTPKAIALLEELGKVKVLAKGVAKALAVATGKPGEPAKAAKPAAKTAKQPATTKPSAAKAAKKPAKPAKKPAKPAKKKSAR